ncbi:class I SAM-dependent methyltransferase [Candidatus Bathyarchaeota archaeon]|nr:class I SAM-dependent methyltransferase [Candidatus Bathyarchaeota archaeon]
MIKPKTIHVRFIEHRDERAEFLWSVYCKNSIRSQGSAGPYLDIGSGNLANANVFRQRARVGDAVGIDITNDLVKSEGFALIQADAKALPFLDRSFELVTMISLIEHVNEPLECLSEALRVAKSNGELVVQFPNRYFPIELHSGLFMYFYLPRRLRNWLASSTGRESMKKVDVPSLRKVRTMIYHLERSCQVVTVRITYPESLLPQLGWILALYGLLKPLKAFHVFPMGFMILIRLRRANQPLAFEGRVS